MTAYAFELGRRHAGHTVTDPTRQGLAPEAAADLVPADASADAADAPRHPARIGAALAVAWVLIVGALIGLGQLVTRHMTNLLGDRTIPHWLAAHRTPGLTSWSSVISTLGATQAIMIVSLATCVVFLAVTRSWRPNRGEHHPTDILGSALFAALWISAAYVLIRPNTTRYAERPADAGRPEPSFRQEQEQSQDAA